MADSATNNQLQTNESNGSNNTSLVNDLVASNNRRDRGPPPMSYFRLSMNTRLGNNAGDDSLQEPLLEDQNISDILPDVESSMQEGSTLSTLITKRRLREYIRRMGNYIAYATLLTMLIIIPIVTYRALNEQRADLAAFDSAGVMVLGVLILSFRLIYLHLTHWYMPDVQKYVVRILWMVPLYAVQSWLSLRFRGARIYISAARDLYEAFVIASFVYYLIELLGGQDALVLMLNNKKEAAANNNRNINADGNVNSAAGSHHRLGHHAFPLNLVLGEEWELGLDFMLQCKHGVLQYVMVKTIATVFTFLFEWAGIYGEGDFKWDSAYPYLAFILNISVMYALYCLVMLFHAVNDELRHPIDWRPLGKFLCIKGVVFFTWWQGVVIFYLKSKGFIQTIGTWSGDDVSNGLIDYCICVEMVFFSIAHSYSFSYKEYLPTRPEIISTIAAANAAAAASASENHPSQSNNTTSGAKSKTASINENDLGNSSTLLSATSSRSSASRLVVPAILDHPMDFRDAFWSSTMHKETIDDLHKFRNGVEKLKSQSMCPGSISLQDINATNSDDDSNDETAIASVTKSDSTAIIDSTTATSENFSNNDDYNSKSNDNDTKQDHNV